MNIAGHCEGVNLATPLQCLAPSPRPSTEPCEQEQYPECTLNQAPMELYPLSVDDTNPDIELDEIREEDLDQQNNEPPSEEKTPTTPFSWEDAAARGKHAQSQSSENTQSYKIWTRSKVKSGDLPHLQ